jgi:hypothetical protein
MCNDFFKKLCISRLVRKRKKIKLLNLKYVFLVPICDADISITAVHLHHSTVNDNTEIVFDVTGLFIYDIFSFV